MFRSSCVLLRQRFLHQLDRRLLVNKVAPKPQISSNLRRWIMPSLRAALEELVECRNNEFLLWARKCTRQARHLLAIGRFPLIYAVLAVGQGARHFVWQARHPLRRGGLSGAVGRVSGWMPDSVFRIAKSIL